jgi:hypothetical protein
MQLSYRGVRYSQLRESIDGSPEPVEMIDSGVEGRYRGHAYHFTYPRHLSASASTLQPARQLCYRGVAYSTTASGVRSHVPTTSVRPVSRPVQPVAEISSVRSRTLGPVELAGRAVNLASKEYNNIHRRYIQERLQHRIDVARAQGNHNLLQMLEREMQQVG